MTNITIFKTTAVADSFDKCLEVEWLETNALGGYSSSTILNGLNIAALNLINSQLMMFFYLDAHL